MPPHISKTWKNQWRKRTKLSHCMLLSFLVRLLCDTAATICWDKGKHWAQKPLNLKIHVASLVVFAALLSNSSPVSVFNFCSISLSLQTSDNIFVVRSLRSLCVIDTKPLFLQLIQWCILNLQPQGYVVDKFTMIHPYLEQIAF